MSNQHTLLALPHDALFGIVSYLVPKDVNKLRLVSRSLQRLCDSDGYWRAVLLRIAPGLEPASATHVLGCARAAASLSDLWGAPHPGFTTWRNVTDSLEQWLSPSAQSMDAAPSPYRVKPLVLVECRSAAELLLSTRHRGGSDRGAPDAAIRTCRAADRILDAANSGSLLKAASDWLGLLALPPLPTATATEASAFAGSGHGQPRAEIGDGNYTCSVHVLSRLVPVPSSDDPSQGVRSDAFACAPVIYIRLPPVASLSDMTASTSATGSPVLDDDARSGRLRRRWSLLFAHLWTMASHVIVAAVPSCAWCGENRATNSPTPYDAPHVAFPWLRWLVASFPPLTDAFSEEWRAYHSHPEGPSMRFLATPQASVTATLRSSLPEPLPRLVPLRLTPGETATMDHWTTTRCAVVVPTSASGPNIGDSCRSQRPKALPSWLASKLECCGAFGPDEPSHEGTELSVHHVRDGLIRALREFHASANDAAAAALRIVPSTPGAHLVASVLESAEKAAMDFFDRVTRDDVLELMRPLLAWWDEAGPAATVRTMGSAQCPATEAAVARRAAAPPASPLLLRMIARDPFAAEAGSAKPFGTGRRLCQPFEAAVSLFNRRDCKNPGLDAAACVVPDGCLMSDDDLGRESAGHDGSLGDDDEATRPAWSVAAAPAVDPVVVLELHARHASTALRRFCVVARQYGLLLDPRAELIVSRLGRAMRAVSAQATRRCQLLGEQLCRVLCDALFAPILSLCDHEYVRVQQRLLVGEDDTLVAEDDSLASDATSAGATFLRRWYLRCEAVLDEYIIKSTGPRRFAYLLEHFDTIAVPALRKCCSTPTVTSTLDEAGRGCIGRASRLNTTTASSDAELAVDALRQTIAAFAACERTEVSVATAAAQDDETKEQLLEHKDQRLKAIEAALAACRCRHESLRTANLPANRATGWLASSAVLFSVPQDIGVVSGGRADDDDHEPADEHHARRVSYVQSELRLEHLETMETWRDQIERDAVTFVVAHDFHHRGRFLSRFSSFLQNAVAVAVAPS